MRWLSIIGLTLNVVGTVMLLAPPIQSHRRYSQAPFFPRMAALRTRAMAAWRRWRHGPQTAVVLSASAAGTFTFAGTVTAVAIPAWDAPTDRQIAYLRQQVRELRNQLGEERQRAITELGKVSAALTAARAEAQGELVRIGAELRDVAAGTARTQVYGMIIIGVGSILAAVPDVLR